MTLKSRFFLVTVITTLAVAGAVIIANTLTHEIHESRFLETTINAKRSFWDNIVTNELDRMESNMASLTRHSDLRRGIVNYNLDLVARSAESTYNRLWAESVITKLEIADRHGAIVLSLPDRFVGKTQKSIVKTALQEQRVVRGIERDDDGQLMAVVAMPIYKKYGKVVGVVARLDIIRSMR